MRKLLVVLLLLFQFDLAYSADFMTLPYTFVARQLISASKVMANYNALRNGMIDGTKKINVAELWINGIKVIGSGGEVLEDNVYKVPESYATVTAALSAIASITANIYINTTTTEPADLEIPSNVIALDYGPIGKIGGSVTVTFNGQTLIAPKNQEILAGTLTITGIIKNGVVSDDWFASGITKTGLSYTNDNDGYFDETYVDQVSEGSAGHGVTVDGVLLKDGSVTGENGTFTGLVTGGNGTFTGLVTGGDIRTDYQQSSFGTGNSITFTNAMPDGVKIVLLICTLSSAANVHTPLVYICTGQGTQQTVTTIQGGDATVAFTGNNIVVTNVSGGDRTIAGSIIVMQ